MTILNRSNSDRRRNGTPASPARPRRAPASAEPVTLTHPANGAVARLYHGDCREVILSIPECAAGTVDMVFADPPFNWNRAYDKWDDSMPRGDYLEFTYRWLDLCRAALKPGGAFWINIPDDTAAEIVCHLKKPADARSAGVAQPALDMINWCIWHYRFGQNTRARFINSKVHALWFVKPGAAHTWNADAVLEPSDRATTYFDPRTISKKDGMPPGMRVPMDVWYGKFWGRIQGNNKERRANHDNQLPEAYLERVIRACSNDGELVMDPFLGSGTTGVIAHALGRRFIGVEFSKDNLASACKRIVQGPHRLGEAIGQSTAIFPARRATPKARARTAVRSTRTPRA
ncbi:MAG: site-specific DNA-methyltransferase [Phycisphaeraceae bacterium]|nr:site-specific DNA-methyltransferase [Phycisphaeraceae bacterium]